MTERFTLISELGRGGMGVVWKARDEETGKNVALKLLHPVFATDPDYVTRFERELELAKRIHSRNVVQVLGFGVRDGTPYLALEFVDGPSLRESLTTHGAYSWPETRALLAQVARGLADAHAAGVIHRDLKPSNVLIGSDGVAKLADFGIAKGLDLTRVTGTSTLLGTPAYLPPEGPVDERSDLYSLGVIAYEMLTGVVPFEGRTYQEVILRHVREAPNLERLPKEARGIVGRLLAKDPKKRPQQASELAGLLRARSQAPAQSTSPALSPAGARALPSRAAAPSKGAGHSVVPVSWLKRSTLVQIGVLAFLAVAVGVTSAGGFLSGAPRSTVSPDLTTEGTLPIPSVSIGQSEPFPSPTRLLSSAPVETPGQSAPATITFTGLGLDAANDSAGSTRTFTFTTDGAGPVTYAVAKTSSGGITKLCAKVDGGAFACKVDALPNFLKGTADTAHSTWTVTLRGNGNSAPTVDVTFTWPTVAPQITLSHGRFQGSPAGLNGFAATFRPRIAGTIEVQASWTSITTDVSATLYDATISPAVNVDQQQYNAATFLSPPYSSSVDPSKAYQIKVLRTSADSSERPDLTAQISFP
jgi:serine/threonine protein kinase